MKHSTILILSLARFFLIFVVEMIAYGDLTIRVYTKKQLIQAVNSFSDGLDEFGFRIFDHDKEEKVKTIQSAQA